MLSNVWFPDASPVETDVQPPQPLPEAEFRIMFRTLFQRELMRVFFAEIMALTGPGTLKDVLSRLGVSDPVQLNCWYQRARGERLPRPELVRELTAGLPGLRVDLHHPMLRWLVARSLDERSIRRIKARLPAPCAPSVRLVEQLSTRELEISPALCERLALHRLRYLDALFVFAYERARVHDDLARTRQLSRVLWSLPILYPDDPLWLGKIPERRPLLNLIDNALGLKGPDDPGASWGGDEREVEISGQLWWARERVIARPRALSNPLTLRRYWAKVWRWRD